MLRTVLATLATAAAALAAPAAHAGGVQWSIGINVPGVVVSNGYYVQPAPVYLAPAPQVRYVPAPQYLPEPVYDAPQAYGQVVYARPQVVYSAYPEWRGGDRERWERQRAWERARWEREHREHRHHDDERRW